MECEVREVFFDLQEVLQIEYFVQRTGTIEVRHLTIGNVQCLRQVHDLCTQRSHTGTTTNPHHFLVRIQDWVEISIRTAHNNLVTRFQREDIRRSDTRHYIHKSGTLFFRLERRGSDTYSQHDTVTFCRIVGHRVSTDGRCVVLAFQREQTELFPSRQIFFADQRLVDILVVIHCVCRNLDLGIRTRQEVHVFTLRQRHDKLFDESSHVLVGNDFAFPFLYTENFVRNLNDHIFLHFALTCQTPVFLNLFTREKALFCRQDFPASFQYLCTALATFTTTTTS